jgi:carbon monoxide dehydrogenase subunit G
MKWSLIAILVVLGALLAITVIGAFLPREHRSVRRAEFHQNQRAIWNTLSDFALLPSWMPGVERASQAGQSGDKQLWTLSTSDGEMTIEIAETDAPRRLVTRIVDAGGPFGGTWTYDITPVDGATRVTITEDGWISNPMYRFLARYVFGTTRTLDAALRGLGNYFGETVLPTAG